MVNMVSFMLNIFYQKKITFSRKRLSVILPLLLSGQRLERSTTSDIRAEVITGICSHPSGPQPQAVRERRVLFCGVALSRTSMVKTFIAFWAILLQILWLEKADFFPSAAVGVSVQVSSEFMSGYMRKKPKQPTGNLLPTRKFLQYYEPSQSTSKSLPFRVFCQMVCEFCPVLNFFFSFTYF